MKRVAAYVLTTCAVIGFLYQRQVASQINAVEKLAPDVYFHEGDLTGQGHCNNGWIIFEDYVLVIDANFPSGAQEIIPKIKAITDKPIRFAFDTHHHGDHAYGNQVWVDNGATPVAHTGVLDEMKKYETGFFGDKPGRWEDAAKTRKDVAGASSSRRRCSYRTDMIFDDGKHRVELLHFGVAHTHGDGFAWLPKEKILFTGDACVNGPYNYTGDGDIGEWIETLAGREARRPVSARARPGRRRPLLEDQRQYFVEVRAEVEKRKSLALIVCRRTFPRSATFFSNSTRRTSIPPPSRSRASDHRWPRCTEN